MEEYLQSTPFVCYGDIHVKREDLCVKPQYRDMFPRFSKLRGVYEYLKDKKERGYKTIGVLDTVQKRKCVC